MRTASRKNASCRTAIGPLLWVLAVGPVASAQSPASVGPRPDAPGQSRPARSGQAVGAVPTLVVPPMGPARPPAAPTPSRPLPLADSVVRRASGPASVQAPAEPKPILPAEEVPPPADEATRAVVKVEGTPAPGLRITLDASGSTGEDLRFLWMQTKGPAAAMGRPDAAKVQVLIPGDANELVFAVVVAGKEGIARKDVAVPLLLHESPSLPEVELTADAGDDQTAIVGHRVTLNGARSIPREGLGYRWIQVEGPKPAGWAPRKWTCTFVPTQPGLYRFLLVVAKGGEISEPSEVRVLASAKPPAELTRGGPPPEPAEGIILAGLARIDGGSRLAGPRAADFDEVAARIGLYRTYEDLFSEISRRLDATLPADGESRAPYDVELIEPLSDLITGVMTSQGLDLSKPGESDRAMTDVQKARLASIFRASARACRAAAGTDESGETRPVARDGDRRNP